jgi:hypothetical protein
MPHFSLADLAVDDLDVRAALDYGEIDPKAEKRKDIIADARQSMLGAIMQAGRGQNTGLSALGATPGNSPYPIPPGSEPDVDPILYRSMRGMG